MHKLRNRSVNKYYATNYLYNITVRRKNQHDVLKLLHIFISISVTGRDLYV